jgi:hypothetical protein
MNFSSLAEALRNSLFINDSIGNENNGGRLCPRTRTKFGSGLQGTDYHPACTYLILLAENRYFYSQDSKSINIAARAWRIATSLSAEGGLGEADCHGIIS